MRKIQEQNNLIDVMWKECNRDDFATQITESTRIDYVLSDIQISDCALKGCYEPFKMRNKGDHQTLLIDFDSEKLFGNQTYNITSPLQRQFTSKEQSLLQKYIVDRYTYLVDHKFEQRLAQVNQCWNRDDCEALD